MSGELVSERSMPLGPGLRAGLAALFGGDEATVGASSRLDSALVPGGADHVAAEAWRGAAQFDESRLGVRWDAYGRTGVACAVLRRAGRAARAARAGR